jgi:pheromone a factor receptor
MHQRHQRIRRKLFFMCISILVPFFPMQMFWLYGNIMAAVATLQPYDFNKSHNRSSTFNLVTFTTSQGVSFFEMNTNYIPILTVLPLFWFFGVTKEAVNIYRVYLLNIGLGKWFPKLHEEYDPDRTRDGSQRSWGQQISVFLKSGSGSGRSSE